VDADVTAVFPGLGYAWWVSERAAVGVRVGVLHVSSDVRPQPATVVHETATVMPVLLHLRLQPFLLTASNRIRPYVTLGLGPVIAHATNVYTGANQNLDSVNEMAIGSLAAAGVDGSVTSRLVVGLDAGFWFIPEFAWRVGPEAGWSSPVVMVSVGWLLGGGDR
jgi:outer membrane protein W